MSPRGPSLRLVVLLGVVAASVLLASAGGGAADPDEGMRRAEAEIRACFKDWRGRVERAAERVAALAREEGADPGALFRRAEEIAREERVDGVAVVDRGNRARFWAGRTFDASPDSDYPWAWRGFSDCGVIENPAHRAIFSAHPAGDEAAVAYLAFEERFPQRRDWAAEIAARTGLERIVMRFGVSTVPVPGQEPLERTFVVDEIAHVTLRAPSAQASAARARRAAAVRR
ncbi:MAG: hypothetical protein ACREID_08755, partial [Planctomycetota bacterium]